MSKDRLGWLGLVLSKCWPLFFKPQQLLMASEEGNYTGAVLKNLPANAGDGRDASLIPGSGRSPGVGNGHPLQYSCLGNPMDRGAWWVTDHGITESQTHLSTHRYLRREDLQGPSLSRNWEVLNRVLHPSEMYHQLPMSQSGLVSGMTLSH